jgi:uncharacterized protein (DUF952 family)
MVAASPSPEFIYKIASRAAFDAALATGAFPHMPIDDTDGYLHFSTAVQLPETLRLYFAGQRDVILIAVRTADLGPGLRWEPSRGGDLFPHYYGDLGLSALEESGSIDIAADGSVELPAWVT